MIPAPDFRLDISINISEDVMRMGFSTIGFIFAMWAAVRIVSYIANSNASVEK